MLAGAHKKFYRIQHPEIYLLDLKVQYKHKIKLPLDMARKHVFLYLCLPNYNHKLDFPFSTAAHFQHGGRQGMICDFLISLLSKALFRGN